VPSQPLLHHAKPDGLARGWVQIHRIWSAAFTLHKDLLRGQTDGSRGRRRDRVASPDRTELRYRSYGRAGRRYVRSHGPRVVVGLTREIAEYEFVKSRSFSVRKPRIRTRSGTQDAPRQCLRASSQPPEERKPVPRLLSLRSRPVHGPAGEASAVTVRLAASCPRTEQLARRSGPVEGPQARLARRAVPQVT
jgi:hypothetical protein